VKKQKKKKKKKIFKKNTRAQKKKRHMSAHGYPRFFLERHFISMMDSNATTKRKREEEEEEEEKEELTNAPLYAFIKRYADIVERFVFPLLTSTELRLLSRVNKEMESVVKNGRVWTSKNRLSDRKFSTQLRARDIQTREMLKYACERNELQPCHRLVGFFSGRGQLECVKYLLEEVFRCTWGAVDRRNAYGTIAAAQNGHFKCLRYLVEEGGCYLNERVCSEACGIGSLKMLRYCRNHFAPWNHRCLERAALGGHKDIVMFLLKHDIDRRLIQSANPAIFAAEGGHLDLVQIFFDRGVVFDERVAEQASEMGYLEILRFVVEKDLPWHPVSCMQACSRPSEYVRDEYYDQIEEIKERHAGCREFILSIFPMMPIMEDGINDIDDDEEEDIMDEEDDGEDVDDPIL